MNSKVIIALSVIAFLDLAAAGYNTCQELQGSCVDKCWQCAGKKIHGKCPRKQICCVQENTKECDVLGGNCIAHDSDCDGMTISEKCPRKHTCCIPNIPACKTPGYTYIEEFNTCIKYFNDTDAWEDAQARCENESSHLIVLDTEAKDNFILNYVKTNITTEGEAFFWFGLFWIEGGTLDDWQWVTGQNISETFNNWRGGTPHLPYCAMYWYFTSLEGWTSESCSSKLHFICEHDANI